MLQTTLKDMQYDIITPVLCIDQLKFLDIFKLLRVTWIHNDSR